MSFGGGSTPKPADLPPAPVRSASDIQDAADRQRTWFYSRQGGRVATLLTGGGGDTSARSAVVRLLGNVGGQ